MAEAKQGDFVSVHYTGKAGDGEVFDTSNGRDPLEFTIGEGEVIPGFEQAVVGMNPGESKTVIIPVDEAYGVHDEDLVIEVERDRLPQDLDPQVGERLQMRQSDGRVVIVVVAGVSQQCITLDANHPLAGKDLTFDIELVGIS